MRTPFALLFLVSAVGSACGGAPDTPSGTPGGSAAGRTVTVTASGANADFTSIVPGTRVLFVNSDTRSHNMTSDPHPEHDRCPEINDVGLLAPGQSRETGNMNTVRTCGFHDHDNPPPNGSRWTGALTTR